MGNEDVKPAGEKEENFSMLARAEELAKRIEEGNKKAEENIRKQEELAARTMLSGRSEAGITPIAPIPMSDRELARKVMNGEINPLTL